MLIFEFVNPSDRAFVQCKDYRVAMGLTVYCMNGRLAGLDAVAPDLPGTWGRSPFEAKHYEAAGMTADAFNAWLETPPAMIDIAEMADSFRYASCADHYRLTLLSEHNGGDSREVSCDRRRTSISNYAKAFWDAAQKLRHSAAKKTEVLT